MERFEILEILSQKTDLKFELSNNLIYPKEESVPLSTQIIDYILSENFDLAQFQSQTFFQMAGSYNHTKIIRQLDGILWQQLNQSQYTHYVESILIENKLLFKAFRIPDLVISLVSEEDLSNKSVLKNPHTIIEVLSPSTEEKDRNQKKEDYFSIDSLQEYMLIAQDSYKIEQFLRKDKTNWIVKIYDSADQTCILTVGVKIKLKDLYKNTDWTQKQR